MFMCVCTLEYESSIYICYDYKIFFFIDYDIYSKFGEDYFLLSRTFFAYKCSSLTCTVAFGSQAIAINNLSHTVNEAPITTTNEVATLRVSPTISASKPHPTVLGSMAMT